MMTGGRNSLSRLPSLVYFRVMSVAVVPGKTKESYSAADDARRRFIFGVAEEEQEAKKDRERERKFSRSGRREGRKGPEDWTTAAK